MDLSFPWLIAIGFVAQLVDGTLGMAYGILATSLLLSAGASPAMASATVHAAEVATSAASGLSHHVMRNVDWRLVRGLAVAGSVGGAAGALLLATGLGELLQPLVSVYLCIMGGLVVAKALKRPPAARPPRSVGLLGLAGGFLDAVGGGGWGPIVTGTLLNSGHEPHRMIGSSVTAEVFVTVAITVVFAGQLGLAAFGWSALALIVGGVPAAPIAAVLVRIVPRRPLMGAVGVLVAGLGAIGAYRGVAALTAGPALP